MPDNDALVFDKKAGVGWIKNDDGSFYASESEEEFNAAKKRLGVTPMETSHAPKTKKSKESSGVAGFSSPAKSGDFQNALASPDNSIDFSSSAMSGDVQGLLSYWENQLGEVQNEKNAISQQFGDLLTSYKGAIENRPNFGQEYQEMMSSIGMSPADFIADQKGKLAQMNTYNMNMVNMEGQKAQALESAGQRLAPMTFIRGEQALIERQYNSRISTEAAKAGVLAAQIQAEQGLFAQANQMATQAISYAMYDYEQKVSDIQNFMAINRDYFQDLRADEKDLINNFYQEAVYQRDIARADKQQVMDWVISYPDASWPTNALDLSMEEAAMLAQQGARIKQAKTGGSGGGSSRTISLAEMKSLGATWAYGMDEATYMSKINSPTPPEEWLATVGEGAASFGAESDVVARWNEERQRLLDNITGADDDDGSGQFSEEELTTVDGIIRLQNAGHSDADILSAADRDTKLNQGSIKALIEDANKQTGKVKGVSREYLRSAISKGDPAVLEKLAKKKGFTIKIKFGRDKGDVEALLDHIMKTVEGLRDIGLSEGEILKKITGDN